MIPTEKQFSTPRGWQMVNSQGDLSARSNPPQGLIPPQIFDSNASPAYRNLGNLTNRSDATSVLPLHDMKPVTEADLKKRSPFTPGSSRTPPSPTNLTAPPDSERTDFTCDEPPIQPNPQAPKRIHPIRPLNPEQPIILSKIQSLPPKTHTPTRKRKSCLRFFWDELCWLLRVLCCCVYRRERS